MNVFIHISSVNAWSANQMSITANASTDDSMLYLSSPANILVPSDASVGDITDAIIAGVKEAFQNEHSSTFSSSDRFVVFGGATE